MLNFGLNAEYFRGYVLLDKQGEEETVDDTFWIWKIFPSEEEKSLIVDKQTSLEIKHNYNVCLTKI